MTSAKFIQTLLLLLLISTSSFAAKKETSIKSQFSYSFNDIQDHLVVIEHNTAVGSGFVAKMNDQYYIFTNQHVIMGGEQIKFVTTSGVLLKPKKVELSATRDIARLLLDHTDGLEISDHLSAKIPVGVFGNSDGGGVATALYGTVTSISHDVIEVSADFVSGNSGSPVLNLDKEVIGIASYVQFSTDKKSKDKDQPETIVRRYCYRLSDTHWWPINWKEYNKKYGTSYLQNNALIDEIFAVAEQWYEHPFRKLSDQDLPDPGLKKWVKNHNHMINRIERMNEKGRATPHQLNNINKQIRKDLIDSAGAFAEVCESRARQMRFFSKQKDLTEFLREEFLRLAKRLDTASQQLEEFKEELDDFNYFKFI